MRGTSRSFASALLLTCALASSACDEGEQDAPEAAEQTPAATTDPTKPAAAPTAAPAGPGSLALPTDAKALPTAELDAAAFVGDACLLLPTDAATGFLRFAKSEIGLEKSERRDRSACSYLAAHPETKLDVWFDSTKQLRSSEKAIELGGVADVRLRVLDKSAELTIPFDAAKDATKMPADRICLRLTLFEHASVTQPYPGPPRPEAADLETALRQLGENAITRLGL